MAKGKQAVEKDDVKVVEEVRPVVVEETPVEETPVEETPVERKNLNGRNLCPAMQK
jgi:hypothetical protein